MSTEALFEKISYPRLAGEVSAASADQAATRGYAAGYAAGARAAAIDAELAMRETALRADELEAEAREALRIALRTLDAAALRADLMRRPVIAEADAALAASALELAEAILGSELNDHAGAARAAVARALSVAANDEVLVVRMNPADLELLGDLPIQLESARLVGDPQLSHGDVELETPVGTIDARLKTSVERARTILLGGEA
jgi:flagellar assembly protein FliH